MKTAMNALKVILLLVIVGFIVLSVWHYIDFRSHPEKYALESAPWYTVVVIWGVVAALLAAACAAAMVILNKKMNN